MLACFEVLARLGSRQAAAAELNITEGAVAKQLRALEHWLRTPLFERSARDAGLTAAGRRLAQAMTAAMETIQLGLDEIDRHPPEHREIALLVPATLAMHWLAPRLPRIERADPGFRLRLHTTHTGEDWLAHPHDAAIRRDGFLPPGYRQEVLFQEELVACAAPALLKHGDGTAPSHLPWLESRSRPGELDRWLAAGEIEAKAGARQGFGHFYTAYEAALAGHGVVVAPTLLLADDVANGRLAVLRPDIRIGGARHVLLWRASDALDPVLAALAAWLRRDIAASVAALAA